MKFHKYIFFFTNVYIYSGRKSRVKVLSEEFSDGKIILVGVVWKCKFSNITC